MKIRLEYYLVNFAAFFCTIPFVAPFPIGSDVQYPVFILCFLVIINEIISGGGIRLGKLDLYFLTVAIISFVYINPFNEYDYFIFKRVGLLFSFFIFYVFSRYWYIVKPKYIMTGIYINFIAANAHYLFTESFSNIADNITRVIKVKDISLADGRGVSGLCPEPGFLGAMSAFFILISYILLKEGKISKSKYLSVFFISVIMMFMSNSGTAMVYLYVLMILFFFFSNYNLLKKVWAGAWIMLFLALFIYYSGVSGRGINIAKNLIENPTNVIGHDVSVSQRELAFAVGIFSIAQGNILGHGVGTLAYVADNIIADSPLRKMYSKARAILNIKTSSSFLLSSFAQYTVELGLIFIILILWLYFNVSTHSYVKIVRVTSLLYLMASFSILFPPLWLLIASTDIRNSRHLYSSNHKMKSQKFLKY